MSKRLKGVEIVGKTTEGKPVLKGISKIYFEQGVPLCFIFDIMIKNDLVPSWIHLYEEMRDNGMPHERIIHLLNEHIFESYGKEFRDNVISTLEKIYK